jgi:type II secretory pathway pseudopilin PulG
MKKKKEKNFLKKILKISLSKFCKKQKECKEKIKSFSLIEISIVLIIIGLLVGSIVGSASLIKTARLRAVISEANKYKIAINAYRVSQDALPGDDDNPANGIANDMIATDEGDMNRKIEALNQYSRIEGTEAFNDMSGDNVGVLDIGLIFPLPSITTNRVPPLKIQHLAPSKWSGGGWTIDYMTTPQAGFEATATINGNVLILTGETVMTPVGSTAPVELVPGVVMEGRDAYSIDRKTDNGDLGSGKVFGIDGENGTAGTYAGDCLDDGTDELCALVFKINL